MRRPFIAVLLAAFIVALTATSAAQETAPEQNDAPAVTEADAPDPRCQQFKNGIATRREHNTYTRKVYRRKRISMKARLRIERMQACAASLDALDDMERYQQKQSKKRKARARARRLRLCGSPACNERLFEHMARRRYRQGGAAAISCSKPILRQESGFNHRINNGGFVGPPIPGKAYGIPQALPGSKMSSAGGDWATNPRTQIRWYFGYVDGRHGGPCGALAFKQAHGWY